MISPAAAYIGAAAMLINATILQADPNSITEAEIAALSLVYLSMDDPDDINRFIYLGYEMDGTLSTDSFCTIHGTATPVFRSVAVYTETMVLETI